MSNNKLSDYFDAVATKLLTRVEVDPKKSNQHEFNGVNSLKRILGNTPEPTKHHCVFIYLSDEEHIVHESEVTWYDARRDDFKRSAEFRLYFKDSPVMELAKEGDLIVFAKTVEGKLASIVAASESSAERKLKYIFNVAADGSQTTFSFDENNRQSEMNFVKNEILEDLGIEIHERADDLLEPMLEMFGGDFPTTREFSNFARETCNTVESVDNSDYAIVEWIDWEHKLFRSLERFIVEKRLEKQFDQIDDFLSFSLSVQNRRKSRAGHALENHMVEIFDAKQLHYDRGCKTENHSKPDFMFPSCKAYNLPAFPKKNLTMLGVKLTCKDRWRQVLSEATRIENKHLLTLEGGISVNQTTEMRSNNLQLVIPGPIHESYDESQQNWLMNLEQFIDLVSNRQKHSQF